MLDSEISTKEGIKKVESQFEKKQKLGLIIDDVKNSIPEYIRFNIFIGILLLVSVIPAFSFLFVDYSKVDFDDVNIHNAMLVLSIISTFFGLITFIVISTKG